MRQASTAGPKYESYYWEEPQTGYTAQSPRYSRTPIIIIALLVGGWVLHATAKNFNWGVKEGSGLKKSKSKVDNAAPDFAPIQQDSIVVEPEWERAKGVLSKETTQLLQNAKVSKGQP